MAKNGEIRLGDKVRDNQTGAVGIAIGLTTWLNGCRRVVVQPQVTKAPGNKPPETFSADEPTVTVLKQGVVKGMNTGDSTQDFSVNLRTSGPAPTPSNYATPQR